MGIEKYEIVMIRSDTFNVMIQYFYAMGKDELCVLFLYLQPGGTVLELCRIPQCWSLCEWRHDDVCDSKNREGMTL